MCDFHLHGAKGWVVGFALGLVVMDLLGFRIDCVGHSIRYLGSFTVYVTAVRVCVMVSVA